MPQCQERPSEPQDLRRGGLSLGPVGPVGCYMIGVVGKPGVNMGKLNHKHVFLKHVLWTVLCFFSGFYLVDVSNMFNATLPA